MVRNYIFHLLTAFLIFSNQSLLLAQEPLRLQREVEHLDSMVYQFNTAEETILFTGSSSIRKWENISHYFPDNQIINTGFGGSQMSDLLFYVEQLILKHKPNRIFIYEGDNDIAYGKSIDEIMLTTAEMTDRITRENQDIVIVFISAKPSIARWELKDKYLALNIALKAYCDNKSNVYFVDVWQAMIDKDGLPRKELFAKDGLHMTEAGYWLWAKLFDKYIN